MRLRYKKKHLKFLRTGYASMPIAALTLAFNARFGLDKTEKSINSALKNYNITCGRKGSDRIRSCGFYTPDRVQFLRENYPDHGLPALTALFNDHFGTDRSPQQIRSAIHNRHITSGRSGCFEKGHQSWNAGTKGFTGANICSFKRGHQPKNWKPLGAERIDSADGYILIKIAEQDPNTGAPTRYKCKHVVVWERERGPVPPGMAVAFRDGVNTNCDPGNLMLISRAELVRLNQYGYKQIPDDLKPSLLAMTKLEVKTFSLLRAK